MEAKATGPSQPKGIIIIAGNGIVTISFLQVTENMPASHLLRTTIIIPGVLSFAHPFLSKRSQAPSLTANGCTRLQQLKDEKACDSLSMEYLKAEV